MVRRSAVLCCALASGCLLTTNLDGLAGDAPGTPLEAGAGDGGLQGDSAAPRDGGGAADAGDASVTLDAQPPSCGHLFCGNFDDGTTLPQGWSGTELSGAGAVSLESSIVTSPPNAFVATMPPMSGFDAALLTKFLALVPTEEHLDLRVYFDQLDVSSNYISLGVLGQENVGGTDYSNVRVNVIGDRAELAEQYGTMASPQSHAASKPYTWPLHQWIHLHVDVNATTASLTIDGTTYATLARLGTWTQPHLALKLGVYYSAGQMGGQRILYDDVLLDAK